MCIRDRYYALGTNKLSAMLGTVFSTGRFIRQGYVDWRLFAPAACLSLMGSIGGTWLQLHTPDVVLKYLLLVVLPVVAVVTLRNHDWPEEPRPMDPRRRMMVVWGASLLIGVYDGYYGPGTGTFLLLVFIRLGKMDIRCLLYTSCSRRAGMRTRQYRRRGFCLQRYIWPSSPG